MSTVIVVIQARLGSTRAPGKVLERIGAYPMLSHVVMRARRALPRARLVIASPACDVPHMMKRCVGDYFGWDGPEEDVLGRFFAAVHSSPAATIVRLTADCPFVDPAGIAAVATAVESEQADYAWTGDQVNGLDAEAFTHNLLNRAAALTRDAGDREHVTPWIRRHAGRMYRYAGYDHLPRYRWTIDTQSDLSWAQRVARLCDTSPPNPSVERLHTLVQANPKLRRLEHAA